MNALNVKWLQQMQWLHILHLPHFNFFRHFLFMFYIAETYNATKELFIEDCLRQSYIIHENISKYLFCLFKKYQIFRREMNYMIYTSLSHWYRILTHIRTCFYFIWKWKATFSFLSCCIKCKEEQIMSGQKQTIVQDI